MDNGNWIALKEVSLQRSGRPILDGVNWEIAPREHWVVLGANGSGKTTLLQLLAGYLWPTRGQLTVLGKRFGQVDLRELRKEIGWVGSFLEARIPPNQKPLDLVVSGKFASIGVFETPSPADYRQAEAIARTLGCGNVLDLPYGVLSQGEKQRLLIARALVHQPQLLILDEPCIGLDLVAREQLLATLQQLAEKETVSTIILVTHHLDEIMPAFDHVLLLKDGRVLFRGPKEEVLKAAHLQQAFGIPFELGHRSGRYWIHG